MIDAVDENWITPNPDQRRGGDPQQRGPRHAHPSGYRPNPYRLFWTSLLSYQTPLNYGKVHFYAKNV